MKSYYQTICVISLSFVTVSIKYSKSDIGTL